MKKLLVAFLTVLLLCVPVFAQQDAVYIPRSFTIYEAACFSSATTGRFTAQNIEIIEYGEESWVLTEINGSRGWVNLRHAPALCVLDEFFTPLGNNISVFYKNIETGFTHIHNPERVFFGASLSKSNHALYTFQLAERGLLDMYEIHTYSSRDEWGGTGVLRFGPVGRELTTRDLLGYSMRESDNAAFRMLVRLTTNAEYSYRQFVTDIGAETRFIRDTYAQNTSARDAGIFMTEIFNYIENPSMFGHYLKDDMLNTAQTSHPHFTRWEGSNGMGDNGVGTDVNIHMIQTDYPLARKYGWSGGAFHDAGIIYAPSPYILVILSNRERGAHDLFGQISRFVQEFNHDTFVSPTVLNAPLKGPEPYDGSALRLAERRGGFRLTVPFFAEDEYGNNEVQTVFRQVNFSESAKINDITQKILFKNIFFRGCADK
ncbi:MAG: class A beta-lactamase-related serine hydrolase [Defluviitaleaceae bacterium]|nr:class A beta-lactamase-related serine hydrolase [Defluviitaleaceae bacterium]